MGLALIATVYTTDRAVDAASSTLLRGQATALIGALRAESFEHDSAQAQLDALMEERRGEGLRYVILFRRDGSVLAEVGDPPADRDRLWDELGDDDLGPPVRLGKRARVVYGRKPKRPLRRMRSVRPRRERRPQVVLMEFEPLTADELRATSRRSLEVGAFAAGALLVVAIALVRWYLRREELERQLAHERRLASLGEMSAVLAHEIRNPIASLKGNAQLLARMLEEGKPRSKAQRLVDESVRLEALTNDLLEFARAGSLERGPVDPVTLLRESAAAVTDRVVEIDAEGAPATWRVDAARLRQVLSNLIENACQASDEPVMARVTREGNRLVISVRDRGEGIAEDALERVFEPFFTRKTRGTGLGLAVARRIVEGHGGTITAGNHAGGGAVFRISIPKD